MCSLVFKLTGFRIATISMLGATNGEQRKLIGVKALSLFGYGIQLLLFGVLPVSESELRATNKTLWFTTQPTKSSKICIGMHLRSLRYPINFSLQHYVAIALAL